MTTGKQLYNLYNEHCVEGCKKHVADNSVDLIITDPPYGIEGDQLHRHYNRQEDYVLDGYVEVPREEYAEFSQNWIDQAARILRPGGALYIFSGYTNLLDILLALKNSPLEEVNHIIWKYNFGVFTQRKYVSSHYHVLYYVKPGGEPTFNTWSRFGPDEKDPEATHLSLNYRDREDVWIINREYKPGQRKNKNELPTALLEKVLQYSSNEGDLVADLFLGSFSTAKVAVGMNRRALGFEISKTAYDHQIKEMQRIVPGHRLPHLQRAISKPKENQKKPWTGEETERLRQRYEALKKDGHTKTSAIKVLTEEFGRGRFGIMNRINELFPPERRRRKPAGDEPKLF